MKVMGYGIVCILMGMTYTVTYIGLGHSIVLTCTLQSLLPVTCENALGVNLTFSLKLSAANCTVSSYAEVD